LDEKYWRNVFGVVVDVCQRQSNSSRSDSQLYQVASSDGSPGFSSWPPTDRRPSRFPVGSVSSSSFCVQY